MKESGIIIIGSLEPDRKYQDNVRVVSGGGALLAYYHVIIKTQ